MKFILYIAFFIVMVISCTNEDYLKYDTSQQDGVYLDYNDSDDSTTFIFGYYDITEKVIPVKVNLMGMPKDYRRVIKVYTNNESVASEKAHAATDYYYNMPDSVYLEKDSVTATIPVTIYRRAELEDSTFIISVNLEPSKDFAVRGKKEFMITFNDKTPPPPNFWTYSLGVPTKKKMILFFKYFRELKDIEPGLYENIVDEYGEYLEKAGYYNNPIYKYRITFGKYVIMKIYNDFLNDPSIGGLSKPRI